jgi:hypothetical protein
MLQTLDYLWGSLILWLLLDKLLEGSWFHDCFEIFKDFLALLLPDLFLCLFVKMLLS